MLCVKQNRNEQKQTKKNNFKKGTAGNQKVGENLGQ